MILTTRTTIGFNIPDEYTEMQLFISNNDMNDWKEDISSQYIYYTKEQTFFSGKVGDVND